MKKIRRDKRKRNFSFVNEYSPQKKLNFPEGFVGKNRKPCGYTKSIPRSWTDKEIKWLLEKKKERYIEE